MLVDTCTHCASQASIRTGTANVWCGPIRTPFLCGTVALHVYAWLVWCAYGSRCVGRTFANRNVWRVDLIYYMDCVRGTGAYTALVAPPARGEIAGLDELRDCLDEVGT